MESDWGKGKSARGEPDLVNSIDVLFGNEEDFSATLGIKLEGVEEDFTELPVASYEANAAR